MIHRSLKRTKDEAINQAKSVNDFVHFITEDISSIHNPTFTNVKEICGRYESSMKPFFILVEGASGIGKSYLSKEIAYQWAMNSILSYTNFLLLLSLSDLQVKLINCVESLAKQFFKKSPLKDISGEWLRNNEGKYVTIIIDGYETLQNSKNCFIKSIINRDTLSNCNLIILSHPNASACLHHHIDGRIEILGFYEDAQFDYLQKTLKLEGCGDKIKDVETYLESNPIIRSLCYIPLNTGILCYLIIQKIVCKLPENSSRYI